MIFLTAAVLSYNLWWMKIHDLRRDPQMMKVGPSRIKDVYFKFWVSWSHHQNNYMRIFKCSLALLMILICCNRMVEHPNLIKLVGYCTEDIEIGTQLFLVYEYMPNRSVRDRSVRDPLSKRSKTPLSWTMRLKVAVDTYLMTNNLFRRYSFVLHFEQYLELFFCKLVTLTSVACSDTK